ncbi:MAG: hypothetical protein FMNOHCHN_00014 [Ignavibacteriaceae bacterium]|nr:hypothetical protein [Ignavibacteriaceae bacterium]
MVNCELLFERGFRSWHADFTDASSADEHGSE